MFSREDWTMFRNLNTISQKAGVPLHSLRRLVLKELVDNSLDECGEVRFGKINEHTYWVADTGKGIQLDLDGISDLFSINRPLTSSKILRVPSRGALGNGLRVVVGSVMASGGSLEVETAGQKYRFVFNDQTGRSQAQVYDEGSTLGTKITVTFGESVPVDENDLLWANLTRAFHSATKYTGKSSPHWYDSDSFYELLMAAGRRTLDWLLPQFEGIKNLTEAHGLIQVAGIDKEAALHAMSRDEADSILGILRHACKPVSAKKIGGCGLSAKKIGEVEIKPGRGRYSAILPYVVEAIATPINEDSKSDNDRTRDQVQCYINATPITGRVQIERHGATKIAAFGCGLNHYINSVSKRRFSLFLNITIPYMPITTDGKEPNFLYFLKDIEAVTGKATRVLRSALKKSTGKIRDVIVDNLTDAIAKVSDNGNFRYSLRQLFYGIRPFVLENPELGELDYGYFGRVIGEHESIYGELKGMYRDPRGTLYHPHTHETIPIGTISVEKYERPDWTFNKILYIEKEGLFEVLKQVGFPEKYDCALLSSKGYASRAVRDVIDLLGDTGEEIKFFCIHDSDGPGTMIYQSLQEGTVARAKRRVKIINLGLDPWEAREMGLQVETFAERKQKVPVSDYVKYHGTDHNLDDDMSGRKWIDWLQTNRVELNAMTSPQFVEWLEGKMVEHNIGKVVPPEDVLKSHLKQRTSEIVRSKVSERILREARFEELVAAEMIGLQRRVSDLDVCEIVENGLRSTPRDMWTGPLQQAAESITEEI